MNAHRNISSNTFGPNTQIHQGDTVVYNYGSSASRKAYFVLPFRRNENIVCRPEIITKLDELLSPSKEGQDCSAALWGLGGSGKTQIALDYAYRRSLEDPTCDIFWVHADSEPSFAQDYKTIARKLGLDRKLSGEELLLEVCDRIESLQRWLLILDNADDVTYFGIGVTSQKQSFDKYIPQGPGGTVLWTSRDQQITGLVGPGRSLQIARMTIEEAEKLLAITKGENRDNNIPDDEIQDTKLLLQELQWLPLAISQAGTFMQKTSTPIKEYLSRLREAKSRWNMLKKIQYDRHRRSYVSNSILEALDISIGHIERESTMAAKVLYTIAYIDTQNISLSVILTTSRFFNKSDQEGMSENEEVVRETIIVRLKEFSFISARKAENDSEPSFDMHKLVQDAVRYRLNADGMESVHSSAALRVIATLFPEEVNSETWSLCEKYATHAIRVSDWTENFEDAIKTVQFMRSTADYFQQCGFLRKAEYMAKKELNLLEKFGEEKCMTVFPMFTLAGIYSSQQLFEEAEAVLSGAIALWEEAHGEKNSLTMVMKAFLDNIYHQQGKNVQAGELQAKWLSVRQETSGEMDVLAVDSMGQHASIFEKQKRYDEAIGLRVEILKLSYEIVGEKHHTTLDAMGNLAETYRLAGLRKKAGKLNMNIISLLQEARLKEHSDMGDLERLEEAYRRLGQYGKAKDIQRRIFLLQQKKFGKKHLDTVQAMEHLALSHGTVGQFNKAEEIQLEALGILREMFGEKNEQTIRSMGITAHMYYLEGFIDKGEEFETKAVSLGREMYGDKLPRRLQNVFDRLTKFRLQASIRSQKVHTQYVAASTRRQKAFAQHQKASTRRKMLYTRHKKSLRRRSKASTKSHSPKRAIKIAGT